MPVRRVVNAMRNTKPQESLLIAAVAIAMLVLLCISGFAQNTDQQIPDAPQPTRSTTFPKAAVPPTAPPAAPGTPEQNQEPAPNITTIPPGSVPKEEDTDSRNKLFTFVHNTNYVNVPVTVKDDDGHLVEGLLPEDFEVLENGIPQKLVYFTSDPFPLTAAVVIDLSMPDVEVAKIRDTLPALMGAFGQFDEVSVFTFGTTVSRVQGFVPAQNDVFIQTIKKLQHTAMGRTGGVPVLGGPMAAGPSVNGRSVNPGAQQTVNAPLNPTIYQPEAHVLNDAILAAADDLATRDPTRRRILFVISNGRELGSDASYSQVLKVLLTHQIAVYGVAVGESAIPGYRQLEKVHIPGQGYDNILPKYAKATGGQILTDFSQSSIETAYNRITMMARNQYTLGYMASNTKSSAYRDIEVRVMRPNLKVTARAGYYPVPPMAAPSQ